VSRVYVGVGSNVRRAENVRGAVRALREAFGEVIVSTVYEAPAVGFRGDDFYNLVVGFDTVLEPEELVAELRKIEDRYHRSRAGADAMHARTLDLDLLLYGDRVLRSSRLNIPREDVCRYDFVLCPLAEIAPNETHPITGQSFAAMWAEYDRAASRLKAVQNVF
jgi:2-amino-4-hydroxy-6-hydroxymethyldihydropteridine diphosphokinase